MTSRGPAVFVAEAAGLDFLNSVATLMDSPVDRTALPFGSAAGVVDWIDSGPGLLDWLAQAELVPRKQLELVRKAAVPGELDAVAAQARALREWFRTFVHARKGRSLTHDALAQLAPLNHVLARDEQFGQIMASHGDELVLRQDRRWRTPDALLLPIASALADLVCTCDFTHVKACEGPTCTLLYVDRTRAHARRWCSMAVCGNRAKQAAHRKRGRST